jgi:asparagine synthase (glutamine-hydrolysing)
MCGLSGSFAHTGRLNRGLCVAMHDRLHHRGPDETYSLNERTLAAKLGRLGMVGLRNGWQPLEDSSGRYIALANGEIYNARPLFDAMAIHPYHGNEVDVAVIPELVARYGIRGLEKIDGQFAAAIYDRRDNALYLARDRFGICPLFHAKVGEVVHFCSELRPLVQAVPNSWRLNYTAIDEFLALGNIVAPRTLVDDVCAVPPGCAVRFDERGEKLIRYWRYGAFAHGENVPDGTALRAGLQQAIARRLSADVDIGAYLSGGFDSSAILVEAAALSDRPVHSFSIVFDEPALDERRFQHEVTRVTNSIHREVRCSRDDIAQRFEEMVRHCCFPQRETYNVAALMLSENVQRAGVKGVVSGEGADELFFGYDSYAFDSARRNARPETAMNEAAWGRADFSWEIDPRRVDARRRNFLSRHALEAIDGQEYWRNRLIPYSERELADLSYMQLRSIADVYVQLAGHLLGDHGDSMVMANSIEGRYPFLGNEVVELALRTPDDAKVADFEGKACLRNAYRGTVPPKVLDRGKHGFTAYDLQSVVEPGLWDQWRELVHSVDALNSDCMVSAADDHREEKWDFRLGAISLAMIVDELSLRT